MKSKISKNRIVAIFIIIPMLLITLTSCSKSKDKDYNRGYESNFEISYRNFTICGELQREESGIFCMTVSSPKDVEGLTIISQNGNTTITYNNIVLNSEDKKGIEASFATLLFDVLDKLSFGLDKCEVSKKSISGKTEKGEFKADVADDGAIEKIVAADGEIEVKFSDFSFDD